MLLQRVLTALVLLAVLMLGLTVAAPWGFPVLALIFVAVAVFEWMRLLGLSQLRSLVLAFGLGLALLLLELYGSATMIDAVLFASALVWIMLMLALLVARRFPEVKRWRIAYAAGGLLFPGACGVGLLSAYRDFGLVWLLSALALVWIADIAAYFCGRGFGRRKLAPSISPGKTIEGALGGIAAVVLLALCSTYLAALNDSFFKRLSQHLPLGWVALILIVLVMLSITGDLFESHLKRQAGVKDSGTILPGHGGVLDRIDALLPVVPIAVLIGRYL